MVHYPSDVICGSLEGLILGILVWYFTKFVISRTEKSEFWLKWDEKLNFEKFYIKKKGKQISKNVALVIIILFVVLSSLVVVGYVMNKNTPIPEGCENYVENCEGCKIVGCTHHPSKGEKWLALLYQH